MSTQTDTHTPGPWAIEEGDRETHIVGGEAILAYCPDWPCAPQEQEANARLIAAAPELMEACRTADQWVAQYEGMPEHDAAAKAMRAVLRAAIAKAKGE